MRRFNEEFKNEESGKRRAWHEIKEKVIKEIFIETKKRFDVVMDQYERIQFPTGITQVAGGNDEMAEKPAISSINILTIDEVTVVKKKFADETQKALDEAIRMHKDTTR